jgi:TM2 domain-containing membrane protein YozV
MATRTSSQWHLSHNGTVAGPYTTSQLAALGNNGKVSGSMMVSKDGGKWVPASKVRGLVIQPPAPPVAVAAAQVVNVAPPAQQSVTTVVTGSTSNFSPAVAAILSLLIPGLGQLYKGQILNGVVWFVFVAIGYAALIVPGVILHICCILGALSGSSSTPVKVVVVRS